MGELLAGELPEGLPETAPLDRIISAFAESSRELYPVVDGKGGLVGLVSLRDVRKILDQRDLGTALIARDIALPPVAELKPDDLVTTALQRFVAHDVAELPVMDPDHPERLLGILARRDLVSAYNLKRAERLQQRLVQEA